MRGGFKHLDTGNSDFKQIYLPHFTQCLHRERAKKKEGEKKELREKGVWGLGKINLMGGMSDI